ncbi:MAG: serine/threonine kinase [Cyanobacteriota bacterium]
MVTSLLNNRYQIIETLGRGGFGETFLAKDTHMPSTRPCVIKHLKPVLESSDLPPWLRERFQREATTLEALGEAHAQIPNLYAYFSEGDDFYLVQEWVSGLTLTQAQAKRGRFSSTAVEELLLGILPVLDFIHQRRIIHRDIKPDNIILRERDDLPILIDFGVIKEAMGTLVNPDGRSAYSVALGTPGYMAPEQAAGRPVFSSDLYSLGLTAIFLLTGKSPQYLKNDSRTGEILWQSEAPYVSPSLVTVINQAIRYHPRERFKSALEMRQALLGPVQQSKPVTAQSSPAVGLPLSQHTEPTLMVGGNPRQSREPGWTTGTDRQPLTESEDPPGLPPLLTWFVMPLVFLLVIVGGILAGFWVANQRRATPPVIDPTPTLSPLESPPNLFVTPEPTPWRSPTEPPTPTPSVSMPPEPVPSDQPSPPTETITVPETGSQIPRTEIVPGTSPPETKPSPVSRPVITPSVQVTPKTSPNSPPPTTPSPPPPSPPTPSPNITKTPVSPPPSPTRPLEVIPPPENPAPNNNTTIITPPAPPAVQKKTVPGEN